MNIKRHGKTLKSKEELQFECKNCGCEFTAEEDEYYTDYNAGEETDPSYLVLKSTMIDYIVCSCPECHKIVKIIKERNIVNYCNTKTVLNDKYVNSDETQSVLSSNIKIDMEGTL